LRGQITDLQQEYIVERQQVQEITNNYEKLKKQSSKSQNQIHCELLAAQDENLSLKIQMKEME
jgi:hypothetical protein